MPVPSNSLPTRLSSIECEEASEAPLATAELGASQAGPLAGPILIVEDDEDIRDTLAVILEWEGFEVVLAPSGEDALQRLQAGLQPGLILLDLMMPGLNGWGVAEQLRQIPRLAGIPILLMSGVHDIEEQATSLGVAGYLRKPLQVERLMEYIRRVSHSV